MRALALGARQRGVDHQRLLAASGRSSSAGRARRRGPGRQYCRRLRSARAGARRQAGRSRCPRTRISPARRRVDAHDGLAERGLAAAASRRPAPRISPGITVERDAVERRDPAGAPAERRCASESGRARSLSSRIAASLMAGRPPIRMMAAHACARRRGARRRAAGSRHSPPRRARSADGSGSRPAARSGSGTSPGMPRQRRRRVGRLASSMRRVGMRRRCEEGVDRRGLDLLARHT